MQMLPVVVDDDFDEGPPEEHAEQDEVEIASLSADPAVISEVPNLPDTEALDPNDQLERQASVDDLPLSARAEVLSGKERQRAEKDQQQAEKERQKAEKQRQKAEKAEEAAAKLCCLCGEKADAKWLTCPCSARSHVECLAKRFLKVPLRKILFWSYQFILSLAFSSSSSTMGKRQNKSLLASRMACVSFLFFMSCRPNWGDRQSSVPANTVRQNLRDLVIASRDMLVT